MQWNKFLLVTNSIQPMGCKAKAQSSQVCSLAATYVALVSLCVKTISAVLSLSLGPVFLMPLRLSKLAKVYASGAARDALVAQSKAHLEALEVQRKLYLRSRSLSLAQRALLYAHDELDMSMMRMQLRGPGESVKPHEQHFRLQPFEVPLKNRVGL